MAKHLSDKDIEDVVELLDQWDLNIKITWDKLCFVVQERLGLTHSRQTLEKHTRIKDAYNDLKKYSKGKKTAKALPASLTIAAQRIERLERENERLKKENTRLLEQFIIWQYNAHVHGMRQDQLNCPLPSKS